MASLCVSKMSTLSLSSKASASMSGRPAVMAARPVAAAARSGAVGTTCSLSKLMDKVDAQSMKEDVMEFKVGHDVVVGVVVKEGNKSRVQPYQGVIIAQHKAGLNSTVTVRKIVQGVGVERTFPIHSPLCTFKPVVGAGTPVVRRAKLYYLRELKGKSARLKIKY
eukprot:CAMPEP_0118936034 /NCGR_PEP_ID=MMETSP1169-20130426/15970_1 /TAXON_ID=36882 /ORGANISM="Pyramimonas obovata, Strain CCMP722" /LENGTH=164 /DNA_ID=CAMNT_0006879131 /DNA_START=87 /DNA_END=581 /DNA_ORIENTATION=+